MRNRAYHISLFIVMLCIYAISYAFKWPLEPQDRPHHITATFGEYRPPISGANPPYDDHHFHDGVDIYAPAGTKVYSVEYDSILEVNARSIITTYHDYRHIIPAIDSPRLSLRAHFSV